MKRALIAAVVAVSGLFAVAPAALASFHEVDVSEVYAGSAGNPESDFVELQMWAPGQNLVNFGQLRIYTTADGLTSHTYTPASSVPNAENNRTILIGDSQFQTEFGFAPDFVNGALDINPTVGAACWPVNSAPIDCISWGAFTGSLPDSGYDNTDSPQITTTQSLTRFHTPFCSTLLEDADDSDVAGDFALAAPSPRTNSQAITESPCTLTVMTNGGGGTGTVTGSGINCGGDCTEDFSGGTTMLTESPTNGSTFNHWSANCTPVMAVTCTVAVSSPAAVTAFFDPPATPTLNVTLAGTGSGTVSDGGVIACPPTCSTSYPNGTPVTLTATPASGSAFSGWGGCPVAPAGNVCSYTADVNRSVTANFSPAPAQQPPAQTTPAASVPGPVATAPAQKRCKKGRKLKHGKCVKKKH